MAVSASYAHLEDEVLHLPLEDRSRLANRLLESLDEDDGFELSPEWNVELQRRVKEIDEGTARMIPHAEVIAKVKAGLAEIRNGRECPLPGTKTPRRNISPPPPITSDR